MPDDQEYATPCMCGSTNRPTRDALSDGEPEVRAIFAQSAVGIAYLGLDGRWLRANRCLCDMLEYTEQDLQQRTIQDITYPDDRGAQRASLHRVLTGENAAYAGEQRFLRPNGSLVWVTLIVSAVCNQSGAPCYFLFLAVTNDITARKQDEEERAALQVREEVIDETAHDLMTSLTSVRGNAALARRRLAHSRTPDIAAVTSPLMAIESATRRMASLIDDLRPSMHAQAGGSPLLERRPTDLVALMRVLIAQQQSLTPQHIRLTAAAPALVVECDAIEVERAAANLLANAITYSPEGGDIMVWVTSEHDATGIWAVLTVQDHGMGIPAEDLPHIFERLYRARNAAGRIHGTGIGLASVRRIVEKHGGTVTAESREGAGSTVTIRLPLQRTPLVH